MIHRVLMLRLCNLLCFIPLLLIFPHESGSGMLLDQNVAIVNDEPVTALELAEAEEKYHQELSRSGQGLGRTIPRKQILEKLITRKILLQVALRSNIRIEDEVLNRTIQNIADRNGMGLDELRASIEDDGHVYEKFREEIREELTISRLRQQQVDNRILVTTQEINNLLASQKVSQDATISYYLHHILIEVPLNALSESHEKRRLQAEEVLQSLKVGADFKETATQVSNDRLALQGGDMGWRMSAELPELFLRELKSMKKGELSRVFEGSGGFHIIKLDDLKKESVIEKMQQTHVRHILISPTLGENDAETRARVRKLKEEITSGMVTFQDTARRASADVSSAIDGGDLRWIKDGETVPEFEQSMNRLKIGEISDPVRTQFGWHLIEVLERRFASHADTEQIKYEQARKAIFRKKSEESFGNWLRERRSQAYVTYLLDE